MTRKEDALTALHGTGSATFREVAEKAKMSNPVAKAVLTQLKSDGKVDNTGDGRWHVK